jgi:hypothetical protein
MTPQERDLAIRTMLAEAGENASPAALAAVANVILNRAQAGRYGGKSVRDVVLAKNQFEPWSPGSGNDPRRFDAKSEAYQRAAGLLDGARFGVIPDVTNGATHFYAPKAQAELGRNTPKWAEGQQQLASFGGHAFYAPEGKVNYDPNATTTPRSAMPNGNTGTETFTGEMPMNSGDQTKPFMGTGGTTGFDPLSPVPVSRQRPQTGNLLGRAFGGTSSGTPQSWGDVFAGAGPQSPLLFRALGYGMQPSAPAAPAANAINAASPPSPSVGGPAANAGGGQPLIPSMASPAAGNSPAFPTPGPNGEAVGGAPGGPMEMLKGLFRGMSPQPQQPTPTGPATTMGVRGEAPAPMQLASAGGPEMPGMGAGPMSMLANLFRGI